MAAYYNEIDPYAAQWLRNLIEAGHIANGVVDERSIEDIKPDELVGYTQCHFFAGIGVWSLALRRAGWPDNRPVWTGSCPCQPFSAAGAGAGFADERHLWPAFHHLIAQCKPAVILGEQVASKAVDPWVDLVHADLEAVGYAFGAVPFPSSSVGAPHIRDRLYWVADTLRPRSLPGAFAGVHRVEESPGTRHGQPERLGAAGRMADADGRNTSAERKQRSRKQRQQPQDCGCSGVAFELLANAPCCGRSEECQDAGRRSIGNSQEGRHAGSEHGCCDMHAGPVNGFWSAADWIFCRDGKWRPVEPGTFPLAHGTSSRVGRLRAYGNAINAEAAAQFIAAYMEAA